MRIKKAIMIKNITNHQHKWLKNEAIRKGTTMSGLIKSWLQAQYEKQYEKNN